MYHILHHVVIYITQLCTHTYSNTNYHINRICCIVCICYIDDHISGKYSRNAHISDKLSQSHHITLRPISLLTLWV